MQDGARRVTRLGLAAAGVLGALLIVAYARLSAPIRIGHDRWGDAAGALVRLLHGRVPVALKDEHLSMFTPYSAATGAEDAEITFADLELHRVLREQPDNVILLQAFPLFVDVKRLR